MMEIENGQEFAVPVQIEKKCFFFKCENRSSQFDRLCCGKFCLKNKHVKSDAQLYDYFLFEFMKYPERCCQEIDPNLHQLMKFKKAFLEAQKYKELQ